MTTAPLESFPTEELWPFPDPAFTRVARYLGIAAVLLGAASLYDNATMSRSRWVERPPVTTLEGGHPDARKLFVNLPGFHVADAAAEFAVLNEIAGKYGDVNNFNYSNTGFKVPEIRERIVEAASRKAYDEVHFNGQSMGGMVALEAAGDLNVAGIGAKVFVNRFGSPTVYDNVRRFKRWQANFVQANFQSRILPGAIGRFLGEAGSAALSLNFDLEELRRNLSKEGCSDLLIDGNFTYMKGKKSSITEDVSHLRHDTEVRHFSPADPRRDRTVDNEASVEDLEALLGRSVGRIAVHDAAYTHASVKVPEVGQRLEEIILGDVSSETIGRLTLSA